MIIVMPEMLSRSSESLLSSSIPKVECTESCALVFFLLLSALILFLLCQQIHRLLQLLFGFGLTNCMAKFWTKNLDFFFFSVFFFCVPEILNLQKWQVMDCSFAGVEAAVSTLLFGEELNTPWPSFDGSFHCSSFRCPRVEAQES